LWATGYSVDYSWLQSHAIDSDGRPVHRRGVSAEPGIYFLGLPWQTRRGSSFIWGVWYDAKYIADHIAKQHAYATYQPAHHTTGEHR
jgi:putative flavoprotein involved in K+ transport